MRLPPILLLLSLLVGCDSEPTTPAGAPPETVVSEEVAPRSESSPPQTIAEEEPVDPEQNPSRIYQLKDLKRVKLTVNRRTIEAWVMDTESKRQEGMMFLTDKEVKETEGMLFVFPEVQPNDGKHGFWMRNTVLPLDIIYISRDKKVINVGKGKPFDESQVLPKGDYLYVLELKRGQAEKLAIKSGTAIGMPADLQATE